MAIYLYLIAILLVLSSCSEVPITRISASNVEKWIDQVDFGVLLVCSNEKADNAQQSIKVFKEVATSIPSISFAITSDISDSLLSTLQLTSPPPENLPAIVIVRHNLVRSYLGPRDDRGMIGYLSQLKNAQPTEITTKIQRKRFQSLPTPRVVGFFHSLSAPEAKEFSEAAGFFNSIPFYIVTDKIIARGLKLKKPPVVQLWKEDVVVELDEDVELQNIVEFVEANRRETLEPLSPEAFSTIISSGVPVVFFFYEPSDPSILSVGREIAKQNEYITIKRDGKDEVVELSYWSVDSSVFGEFVQKFGVSQLPTVGVLDLANQKQIVYPSHDINVDEVTHFIKNFLEGKVKQEVKSEEAPDENPGPVFKVVTNTFFDMVMNDERTVILKAYTDWCGHCKNLAPIWTELAEDLESMGRHDVVLTEIDVDKNVVPVYEVKSLPTLLKFKPGMKNEPEVYTGSRDKGSLMQWILA
ncbi:hypothetical protein GEMRC1_007538 [Eukaryota sp. GEM-RC1]